MTDIHIIAPFSDTNDEDWQAIDLYLSLYKEKHVQLWCPQAPHKDFAQYPIQEIKPYQGKLPNENTLYVVGAHTEIGHWYEQCRFEKITIIHNSFSFDPLYRSLNRLALNGSRKIEIRYVSNMLKEAIGLPGEVIYPIPHPSRFQSLEMKNEKKPFTVGRISRDNLSKHHFGDPDLYRRLAANDMRLKIFGGTCLQPWLPDVSDIELLPELPQESISPALNTLDCFYYRTALAVKEAFGAIIAKAMLSGLPVVCSRNGSHVELIEHKTNGFLFDTEEEAIEIIYSLQRDPELRQAIGQKARLIH